MNLGELINTLEGLDPSFKVRHGFARPHSWRGIYAELAFEYESDTTIREMLEAAREAVGATYTGWKGGEYTMFLDTEVHIEREEGCYSDGEFIEEMISYYVEDNGHDRLAYLINLW